MSDVRARNESAWLLPSDGTRTNRRLRAGMRRFADADCRSFAVPNLCITDGSVLPTQGSANPALTIMAVAARAADRPIGAARRG